MSKIRFKASRPDLSAAQVGSLREICALGIAEMRRRARDGDAILQFDVFGTNWQEDRGKVARLISLVCRDWCRWRSTSRGMRKSRRRDYRSQMLVGDFIGSAGSNSRHRWTLTLRQAISHPPTSLNATTETGAAGGGPGGATWGTGGCHAGAMRQPRCRRGPLLGGAQIVHSGKE